MGLTDTNFAQLMQSGRAAYMSGNRKLAHDLWRDAAQIDPYNEQVWLALLSVLEGDADRRVCLQNIIAINPLNVQARRQLNKLEARAHRIALYEVEQQSRQATWKRNRSRLLRRAVLLGIAVGVSGILFAVVISILLYAR